MRSEESENENSDQEVEIKRNVAIDVKSEREKNKKNKKKEKWKNSSNRNSKNEVFLKNSQEANLFFRFDFGQYGFNNDISVGKIKQILKNFDAIKVFGMNPDVNGVKWRDFCKEFSLKKSNYVCLLKKDMEFYLESENEEIRKLRETQYHLWEGMSELQHKMSEGSTEPGLLGVIKDQIEYSSHLLACLLENNEEKQYSNPLQDLESCCQQYWGNLALKTFERGFSQEPIDRLNYFKNKEYEEGKSGIAFKPIESQQEWADFIAKRRNKLRKADKFLLHTACQSCLSPYTEVQNPVINCPQCHLRCHELCLDLSKVQRCGRCIYSRLPKEVRQSIPECFLCGVRNLTPTRVSGNKFAHIFCMLSNGYWVIEKKTISMARRPLPPQVHEMQCSICQLMGNFYTHCEDCLTIMHPLCAFLSGYTLFLKPDNTAGIRCCHTSAEYKKELAQNRKYICNYMNIVFKKLNSQKLKKSYD